MAKKIEQDEVNKEAGKKINVSPDFVASLQNADSVQALVAVLRDELKRSGSLRFSGTVLPKKKAEHVIEEIEEGVRPKIAELSEVFNRIDVLKRKKSKAKAAVKDLNQAPDNLTIDQLDAQQAAVRQAQAVDDDSVVRLHSIFGQQPTSAEYALAQQDLLKKLNPSSAEPGPEIGPDEDFEAAIEAAREKVQAERADYEDLINDDLERLKPGLSIDNYFEFNIESCENFIKDEEKVASNAIAIAEKELFAEVLRAKREAMKNASAAHEPESEIMDFEEGKRIVINEAENVINGWDFTMNGNQNKRVFFKSVKKQAAVEAIFTGLKGAELREMNNVLSSIYDAKANENSPTIDNPDDAMNERFAEDIKSAKDFNDLIAILHGASHDSSGHEIDGAAEADKLRAYIHKIELTEGVDDDREAMMVWLQAFDHAALDQAGIVRDRIVRDKMDELLSDLMATIEARADNDAENDPEPAAAEAGLEDDDEVIDLHDVVEAEDTVEPVIEEASQSEAWLENLERGLAASRARVEKALEMWGVAKQEKSLWSRVVGSKSDKMKQAESAYAATMAEHHDSRLDLARQFLADAGFDAKDEAEKQLLMATIAEKLIVEDAEWEMRHKLDSGRGAAVTEAAKGFFMKSDTEKGIARRGAESAIRWLRDHPKTKYACIGLGAAVVGASTLGLAAGLSAGALRIARSYGFAKLGQGIDAQIVESGRKAVQAKEKMASDVRASFGSEKLLGNIDLAKLHEFLDQRSVYVNVLEQVARTNTNVMKARVVSGVAFGGLAVLAGSKISHNFDDHLRPLFSQAIGNVTGNAVETGGAGAPIQAPAAPGAATPEPGGVKAIVPEGGKPAPLAAPQPAEVPSHKLAAVSGVRGEVFEKNFGKGNYELTIKKGSLEGSLIQHLVEHGKSPEEAGRLAHEAAEKFSKTLISTSDQADAAKLKADGLYSLISPDTKIEISVRPDGGVDINNITGEKLDWYPNADKHHAVPVRTGGPGVGAAELKVGMAEPGPAIENLVNHSTGSVAAAEASPLDLAKNDFMASNPSLFSSEEQAKDYFNLSSQAGVSYDSAEYQKAYGDIAKLESLTEKQRIGYVEVFAAKEPAMIEKGIADLFGEKAKIDLSEKGLIRATVMHHGADGKEHGIDILIKNGKIGIANPSGQAWGLTWRGNPSRLIDNRLFSGQDNFKAALEGVKADINLKAHPGFLGS